MEPLRSRWKTPPGSLCSAMAVSIVRSISRRRSVSKVLVLCIVVQPDRIAASAAALSLRMLPLLNERANGERRQRPDDGVPRPRYVSSKTDAEDDGDSDGHACQRGARSAAFGAAEKEHAEDRAVDE